MGRRDQGVAIDGRPDRERPAQGHLVRRRRLARLGPGQLRRHHSVRTRATGTGTLSLRWGSPTRRRSPRSRWTAPAGRRRHRVAGRRPDGTGQLYVTSTGGVVLDSLTFVGNGVGRHDASDGHGDARTRRPRTVRTAGTRQRHRRRSPPPTTAPCRRASTPSTAAAPGSTPTTARHDLDRGHDHASSTGPPTTAATSRRSAPSTIKIDKTGPVVTVAGVTAGQSVANTADVTWTATDAISGMDIRDGHGRRRHRAVGSAAGAVAALAGQPHGGGHGDRHGRPVEQLRR